MMSEVVFNFHDVILLMTAMQCLFFTALLCATNTQKLKSTYFLAAFLLAHAFIPLHELILWGAEFKYKIRDGLPGIYFLPGAAYYFDGAILFFCVKSLVFRDFSLKKVDFVHLIPFAIFLLFMGITFYSHSTAERQSLIDSESFVYSSGYIILEFLCKGMRVAYVLSCLILLTNYKRRLQSTHSNIERVDLTWMNLLVIGILVVLLMELSLSIAKIISLFKSFEFDIFSLIGLSGYYTLFMLINLFVFTSLRYFENFKQVHQNETVKKTISIQLLNPGVADEIDKAMKKDRTFLQADITLEQLADSLSFSARDLSMLINRHYGLNFYEFINRYRIEEAKRLLRSEESRRRTITDIYLAVGFNSKSVFNTFFKKLVGKTPSQYRKAVDVDE